MNRFIPCIASAAIAAAVLHADTYEIGEALTDEAFWKTDPAIFIKDHKASHGFEFTRNSESADSRLDGAVTYFGVPVFESRIIFAEQARIERVELMLFSNAGTEAREVVARTKNGELTRLVHVDKSITREGFLKILTDVRAHLTPVGGKNPKPIIVALDRDKYPKGQVQKVQTWPETAIQTATTLTWNYFQDGNKNNTFRPGFIRVAVDGPFRLAGKRKTFTMSQKQKMEKGKRSLLANVVSDTRGDVFVDNVPMVDQGQKGYCAAAAAERVLRYYGVEVDEHEIAQAAGTTVNGGTDPRDMKESVDVIGKQFRLATMTLYGSFDKTDDERIAGLSQEVDNYNKAAKKLRKPKIEESVYVKVEGNYRRFSISAVDEAMDPDVLKDMKVNGPQKSKYKKFMADIHQYVNAGMPLFWGVKFGVYPEPHTKQELGYHMRLIIGYNDKKREILYSDTWGAGHDLKRMPADWAWTISRCLMVMKPLK